MRSKRWKVKLAVLSTGTVLQFWTLGAPTGCLDFVLRLPTIGVSDIELIRSVTQPQGSTRPLKSDPSCHDGIDNDRDGLRDAEDPDCWAAGSSLSSL